MPKEYKQKVRDAWMEDPRFKTCIKKDGSDPTKVFCTYCKSTINAKLWDLKSHVETKKHKERVASLKQNATIDFTRKPTALSQKEAALCLFVAQHCAISPVDHLNNLCTHVFNETNLKIHRTKCINVIKNVLSPHFQELLHSDIGESKFSLMIDESTDISITKVLGVAINYFSMKQHKIVSTFLCIVKLENADAVSIATALKDKLKVMKINLNNLIGIGTDNAAVMVGSKKSVYQELKKDVPSLILIKCVCHSVQLAVNHACKRILPGDLEFLIYETYNWFAKSSKRQMDYRRIYQVINNEKDPLKIPRVSDTIWLSIETAVSRILNQWDELKLHFEIAATEEKCHKAQILRNMFADKMNHAYLLFLKPILENTQTVNKSFQGKNVNATKLLGDLRLLINSLKSKILPPNVDDPDFEKYVQRDLYLGYMVETYLKSISIDSESESSLRTTCTDFVIELIKQLSGRLPDNFDVLEKMSAFNVNKVLHPKKDDVLEIVSFFKLLPEQIERILNQYATIHHIKWSNIDHNEKFWAEVFAYKDSGGQNPFHDLASFAIMLLSLPWSNAEVERVFSQVNIVKTKHRNKMEIHTLNSILDIRYGLRQAEKCCFNYSVPKNWLNMIGTNLAYNEQEVDVDEILATLIE